MSSKVFAVCTFFVGYDLKPKELNAVLYKTMKSAKDSLKRVYDNCYPEGFDQLGVVPSPEKDSNGELVGFTSSASYRYAIVEKRLED